MTSPTAVASSFGRAAARYRQHARVQQAMADWLAEWLPPVSNRTGSALELGAGPGVFTEKLLPWSGPLLATDLSAEMCAEGARRLPQVAWQPAFAEAPPAGPWDWILTSSMLQWVTDPVPALSAWRRELSPGGRLLGGLFVSPTIPEWLTLASAAAPFEWRPAEEWNAALQSAGLTVSRCETKTFYFEFSSAVAFLRCLHAIGAAPARRIPPERLRSHLREYDARFGSPTGVRSSWTFFRFEATR